MLVSIAMTVLVVAGLALTVYMRKYESNIIVFLVMLAASVYVVGSAVNAIMLEVSITPHVVMGLICLWALGTSLYRRRKRAKI